MLEHTSNASKRAAAAIACLGLTLANGCSGTTGSDADTGVNSPPVSASSGPLSPAETESGAGTTTTNSPSPVAPAPTDPVTPGVPPSQGIPTSPGTPSVPGQPSSPTGTPSPTSTTTPGDESTAGFQSDETASFETDWPQDTDALQTEDIEDPGATSDETSSDADGEDPSNDSTQEPNETSTSDEVPAGAHCAPAAAWDPAWSQWEEDVLQLVNDARSSGANCGSEGSFAPASPVSMDPMLRCSARLHSEDMFVRDYFSHENPDGEDPFERMAEAGFEGGWMGENIAAGQQTPEEVMQAWLDSDGHCSNIMNPNFTLVGVGYYPGGANWQEGQHFWTQNFGKPL